MLIIYCQENCHENYVFNNYRMAGYKSMKRFLKNWLIFFVIEILFFILSFILVQQNLPFLEKFMTFLVPSMLITAVIRSALFALLWEGCLIIWRRYDKFTSIILILVFLLGISPWFGMHSPRFLYGKIMFSVLAILLGGVILLIRWLVVFIGQRLKSKPEDQLEAP
jgi:hypothetical protein